MAKYDIEALRKKYHDFFVPDYKITVDGQEHDNTKLIISNFVIESSLDSIAEALTMEASDAFDYDEDDFKMLDVFKIGKQIKVEIGYSSELTSVFEGYITSLECNFSSEDMPTMTIRGMSNSFLMMKGKHSSTWLKMKYSDIVSELASKYSMKAVTDATKEVYEIVEQYEESDFDFIKSLAAKCNFNFYVNGKNLYFKEFDTSETEILELTLGKEIMNFSLQADIAGQIEKAVVRGIDPKDYSKVMEGTASSIKKIGSGQDTGISIMKKIASNLTTSYIYSNVNSVEEANTMSDAILNKSALQFVTGKGECVGIPEMVIGKNIKLNGLGSTLSSTYYIKSVTHNINESGYTTSFVVGGNAL